MSAPPTPNAGPCPNFWCPLSRCTDPEHRAKPRSPDVLKRATLTIPAPLAVKGEAVMVLNYRMRPARWQSGTIESAEYHHGATGRWVYGVRLDRLGPRGPIRLTVGDESVVPTKGTKGS